MSNNKQPKKPPVVEMKGGKGRVFKFNMTNLLLVTGGIFLLYIVGSTVYQPSLGKSIEFSLLIDGIVNNKYAQVDFRSDEKAVAYDKYIDYSESTSNINFNSTDNTDVQKSLKEITLGEFLEEIKQPETFQETISNLFGGEDVFKVGKIIVGENNIIIERTNKEDSDVIIRDISEDEFRQSLIDNNRDIDGIAEGIAYTRSAAKVSTAEQIETVYKQDKYSDIWIIDGSVVAILHRDQIEMSVATVTQGVNESILPYLQEKGFELENGNVDINLVKVENINLLDLMLFIGMIALIGALFFVFRGIQGSNNSLMKFGQSKAGVFFGRKPDVTFEDVAGVDVAKEELKEVVMFLKNPKKFLKLGARIPKGLLLVGQPGTGKTLLARAIAGEAGVPFFHTSGSEFEEMLVGAGASRVRDLFDKAKKAAPALIFIDEIDAVARKRGTTIQSSTTEQTLNQILVEMDGFKKNENLIVIAATNRPDVLDPAILRPGRFDRRVVIDLPDMDGRVQILEIHSANKPLASDVDLKKVAKRTVGFSGADIENMLNEAAIITAKADRNEITNKDIEEAATKVSIGPERKTRRDEYELKVTAYHEAGHAIVARLTPMSDPVHRITIVSRGMSLGSTMQLPQMDKMQQTKTELESRLKVLLGGRAAEEIIFDDITGGASNDIEKATSIARKMVKLLGMSDKLGLIKYGQSNELQYLGYGYGEQRDYSDKTAEMIDQEVIEIINKAYEAAKKILKDNEEILHKVSKDLLDREVIEDFEFEEYFKDHPTAPKMKVIEGDSSEESKEEKEKSDQKEGT